MTTLLAYKQPDNMEQFLCQQIEARIKNGSRSIVYTEQEMQNIFTLYDLKNSGNISKDQCREGKSPRPHRLSPLQNVTDHLGLV